MMKLPFLIICLLFLYGFAHSQANLCYSEKFTDTTQHVFEKIDLQASYTGFFATKWNPFLEKNVEFANIVASLPDTVKFFADTVIIKFIVSKAGVLSDLTIIRALNDEVKKEAIRLLKASSCKWVPGTDGSSAYRSSWHQETFYFLVDRRNKTIVTKIKAKL